MKRKLPFICCLLPLLSSGCFAFGSKENNKGSGEEDLGTPIDMYLIAGQSNAAGYSAHLGKLKGKFFNVGYAGQCDYNYSTGKVDGSDNLSSFENYLWQVSAGLGCQTWATGPEYGMAEVLNDRYNVDHKAFIFKSAAGATPLIEEDNPTCDFGNWCPKSLWNNDLLEQGVRIKTGWQYYNFVNNFKSTYEKLKANGFSPRIKGMVWMQGEADLGNHNLYEECIKIFISDIRNDLKEITKDDSLAKMPFVIGKIATSFAVWNNADVPAFNLMQEKVANELENVATVETSDLVIVKEDGTINGTDKYHFKYNDIETLGNRFANKLLDMQ